MPLKKGQRILNRKRSPRPLVNNGTVKSEASSKRFKELWADPVWSEKMREKRRLAGQARKGKGNFRQGVPDGMRKAEADVLWARAAEQAKRFIKIMEDAGELPDVVIPGTEAEMARLALEEAFKLAVGPMNDMKVKTTAIRTVLDFTKSKPETKSKLTLDKSEEWLDALADDMKRDERAE